MVKKGDKIEKKKKRNKKKGRNDGISHSCGEEEEETSFFHFPFLLLFLPPLPCATIADFLTSSFSHSLFFFLLFLPSTYSFPVSFSMAQFRPFLWYSVGPSLRYFFSRSSPLYFSFFFLLFSCFSLLFSLSPQSIVNNEASSYNAH